MLNHSLRHFCMLAKLARTTMAMEQRLPYRLVDIGANLAHPSFAKDLDAVIGRAEQAGLAKIMITGTSIESTKQAAHLAKTRPGFFYFTAGVHPHDAKLFTPSTATELEQFANHEQCVAIGECGLDFNRNFSPQEQQLQAFEEQVKLACRLKKPLFIHEREASAALINVLNKYKEDLPPAVVHCFTGTEMEAKEYIAMGLYIGITGFLWKDRSDNGARQALATGTIPLDRLVLETDAPYMFPKLNEKRLSVYQSHFSSTSQQLLKFCSFNRNEPCALAGICELIAAIMQRPAEEVAEVTTRNAIRIYGLDERR